MSKSKQRYVKAVAAAQLLLGTATDQRLQPIAPVAHQTYLHAALAMYVAGWDGYLKAIVREYFTVCANPLDIRYSHALELARLMAEGYLKKFNTPNYENSRSLLLMSTGYDPISDWIWKRRNMGSQAVKERMNEILKVRHSFAHGSPIPAYQWTMDRSGRIRLTVSDVRLVGRFFDNLVNMTDRGLASFIAGVHQITNPW